MDTFIMFACVFFGLFAFLLWVHEYPDISAQKFKDDNDISLYRTYRKKAYLRYALYFLVPSALFVITTLLFNFLPFEICNVLWRDYLSTGIGLMLIFYYLSLRGTRLTYLIWTFESPTKYCYIKRVEKDSRFRYILNLILFNALGVVLLIFMIVKFLRDFAIM